MVKKPSVPSRSLDALAVERNRPALRVHHALPVRPAAPAPPADDRTRAATQTLDIERLRKEIFIATLAHELRQPLSTLLAAVEVVRLNADSPEGNRITAIMRRQIGQMNRVIEDLLDTTRWAHGNLTLRKERLDLRQIVRDAAADAAAAVAARGHVLDVEVPSNALSLDGDPQRLQQVLSNLLRNAIKYTNPGGRISLTASQDDDHAILRVADTGRGIAPEALPYLFEAFSEVRSSDTEGLGIGLSIVREIVTRHDGRIEARSAGLGQGSEFIVTLPMGTDRAGP